MLYICICNWGISTCVVSLQIGEIVVGVIGFFAAFSWIGLGPVYACQGDCFFLLIFNPAVILLFPRPLQLFVFMLCYMNYVGPILTTTRPRRYSTTDCPSCTVRILVCT